MIKLDCKDNEKLKKALSIVNSDKELMTTWKCSNINAIDRLGYSDHGPMHVQIVVSHALRILRLLVEGGVKSSIVEYYDMGEDDAEVVTFLAAAMHDLGISAHRDNHEEYSMLLSNKFLDKILPEIYDDEEKRTVVKSEVLHAVISHSKNVKPYTIESGAVKLADALDMEKGRARIAFNIGKVDIYSVSALAIESVSVEKGEKKPVVIRIRMLNSAGVFQIDELLKRKFEGNPISKHISVIVDMGNTEKKIIDTFEVKWS